MYNGTNGDVPHDFSVTHDADNATVEEGMMPTFTYTADEHAEVHFLDISTQTIAATYVVGPNRTAAEYVNGLPVVAKVERCGWERPVWAVRGVAKFELGAAALEVRALGDDEVMEPKYYHPPGPLENKFANDCLDTKRDAIIERLSDPPVFKRGCRAEIPTVPKCKDEDVPNCATDRLPCATMDKIYVDELPEERIFEVDLSILGTGSNATNATNATNSPTLAPTSKPTLAPTISWLPTSLPTAQPTFDPTAGPTSGPTPRPTPECAPTQSLSNGEPTETFQNYELTFTMELADVTQNRTSILHIGSSEDQRLPRLWINEGKLEVVQSNSSGAAYWGVSDVPPTFKAGEHYEIKVVIENNQMAVYINGKNVGTASGSATYFMASAAVNFGEAVSGVCLREIYVPSSAPTAVPTPVPTQQPTACPPDKVLDCSDDDCCPRSWIGDGYCDGEDQEWDCDLSCYYLDGIPDGGDCAPTPSPTTTLTPTPGPTPRPTPGPTLVPTPGPTPLLVPVEADATVEFLITSQLCLASVSAANATEKKLQGLVDSTQTRDDDGYPLGTTEGLLLLADLPTPEDEGLYGKACTNDTDAVFREEDAVKFGFELVEREPVPKYFYTIYPWDKADCEYKDTLPSAEHPIAIRVADGVSKTESSATYDDEPFAHIMIAGPPNPFAPFSHELSVEFTRAFDGAEILFVRHALVVGVIPEEVPQVWTVATNPTLVFLILRDPPGGGSFATLTEGSAISTSMAIDGSHAAELADSWKFGATVGGEFDLTTGGGACFGGMAFASSKLLGIGGKGGLFYEHASPDVTVSRASSRHFDIGISFETSVSTSSSPFLPGQPSDVIVGGGANLRFISAIEIFAKANGNGLCLGGLTTQQFLPEQVSTWVMSVYEIEKTIERLGAALTDPNTKMEVKKDENGNPLTDKDGNPLPNPRDDIAKQIENWQTVLANYRAATIRDQAESVAEQLSSELKGFYDAFKGFVGESVKNGDTKFTSFLASSLDEMEKNELIDGGAAYRNAGTDLPSEAQAEMKAVDSAIDQEGPDSSARPRLKTFDRDLTDRVNDAAAKCIETVGVADPSGTGELCRVYAQLRQGLQLKDKLLGVCGFESGQESVDKFCQRNRYRAERKDSKEIGAFGALSHTDEFITFSGTTGLEFSWDIAESRGQELTSTHEAKIADAVGGSFSAGGEFGRRLGEAVGGELGRQLSEAVEGYAYPTTGRVLAVSKKLLEVTPETLEERRRLGGKEKLDVAALNKAVAKINSKAPEFSGNPCGRRLDDAEISNEERRRLGIQFCGSFDGSTSTSFDVSLSRAASKGAEHTRAVAVSLNDDNTQDLFVVRVSQDSVYGTPIFTTMGGRSSCVGETGTTRRDSRVTIKEIKPLCVSDEDLQRSASDGEALCRSMQACECKGLAPGEDAIFSVVLENLSPWVTGVRYLLRAANGASTAWDSGKYARVNKEACSGDAGSLAIGALASGETDLRIPDGYLMSPLAYGQSEVRVSVSRPDSALQCSTYENIELELVASCEATDWDSNQEVYQYWTTMNAQTGEVSVIHPKFVGRPVGDCALTSFKADEKGSEATDRGTGRWCYSDLNLAVGCTASPKACWETCSAEVEKIDGKEGPPSDIATSCPAPFIKAVEPGKVKCDVGALEAIDWEEETGQCRCQNNCDCLVEDLYTYDVTKNEGDPGYETRETTTHLLTKDGLDFPPKDEDGEAITCGLYTFTETSKARGSETSTATFDVSWKNEVHGCTYEDADNYDPRATVDDLSCVFTLRGCPYPAAANYNPAATKDDGSCVFAMPRSLACDADLPEKAYSSACRVSEGKFIYNYGVSNDEFWKDLPPTKGSCEAKDGITNWCPAAPFVCSQPASCLTLDNEFGILENKVISEADCVATDKTVVKWCPFETDAPTAAQTQGPSAVPTSKQPTQPESCTLTAAAEALFAKRGCTYEVASNYKADATFDDGSCEFSEKKPVLIAGSFCIAGVNTTDASSIQDMLQVLVGVVTGLTSGASFTFDLSTAPSCTPDTTRRRLEDSASAVNAVYTVEVQSQKTEEIDGAVVILNDKTELNRELRQLSATATIVTAIASVPSQAPSFAPTSAPTLTRPPTLETTPQPTPGPTLRPTVLPTVPPGEPTAAPITEETDGPTPQPTLSPTGRPGEPTAAPLPAPTTGPEPAPTLGPKPEPTLSPTLRPGEPTAAPLPAPTTGPEPAPTLGPKPEPTLSPTLRPGEPTAAPLPAPTTGPEPAPTLGPKPEPTLSPTGRPGEPTAAPLPAPTTGPEPAPTLGPKPQPTLSPTVRPGEPTAAPLPAPTTGPEPAPTLGPKPEPTLSPTVRPGEPTAAPLLAPTMGPEPAPTLGPKPEPTLSPTGRPGEPTAAPLPAPTTGPEPAPTLGPKPQPTLSPTLRPGEPTAAPLPAPTTGPEPAPTLGPKPEPTLSPTVRPGEPTAAPLLAPTMGPEPTATTSTKIPTPEPTFETLAPTLGGCPALGTPDECPKDATGLPSCAARNLASGGLCVGNADTCPDMPVSNCPASFVGDRRRLDDGGLFVFKIHGALMSSSTTSTVRDPCPFELLSTARDRRGSPGDFHTGGSADVLLQLHYRGAHDGADHGHDESYGYGGADGRADDARAHGDALPDPHRDLRPHAHDRSTKLRANHGNVRTDLDAHGHGRADGAMNIHPLNARSPSPHSAANFY